jgi:hypothetical protein
VGDFSSQAKMKNKSNNEYAKSQYQHTKNMKAAKFHQFLSRYWILLLLLAIKILLQYAYVNPLYELHRDEFLHLDQAFHPAAGYISVPPFTSWIAGLVYLLGGTLFWIRFFPALFGALTIAFAWLIVEELGGRLPARILTALLLTFSVYARLNVLFQPNAFDILTWTVMFYLVIKFIRTQHDRWLFLLSVAIALGFYNKYNVAFLLAGLLAGLLLSEKRTIFNRRTFYLAAGLALILLLPNIIWQVQHGFPVVFHMRGLRDSQLVFVDRTDLLLDQVKYGVFGIPAVAAFWALIFYKPFKPYRAIGWTFLIVMTLFTISRAKSYYTLGLYPVLFAMGCVYLEVLFRKRAGIIFSLFALVNLVLFFGVVKYLMPFEEPARIIEHRKAYERLGLLRWEDGQVHPLPQDFADMLGWKEMAEKAWTAYQMIPSEELTSTLIFCDNYGQTGALNYYNRNKMPMAYSFSTDYIYWLPPIREIKNILFVGEAPDRETFDLFEEYRLVGKVENLFAREQATQIFLLLHAKPELTELFFREVEDRKREFDIF